MRKKGIIFTIVILAALAVVWNIESDYSKMLEANWGFSLPANARCTEIYEQDSDASFHGDGIRYHIFSYKYEEPIDTMLAWSSAEKNTQFGASYSQAASEWLAAIDVAEEYYPDCSNCVYWYQTQEDNSQLIVFWDSQMKQIYVLESFV